MIDRGIDDTVFRVSITGIDGSGKDTVTKGALTLLSREDHLTVLKLGRPAYRIDDGDVQQVFGRTTRSIDRIHHYFDDLGSPTLIAAANALNVVVQARLLERSALRTDGVAVIGSSRDARLDPVVYADFYTSQLAGRVDMPRRGQFMQRLTGIQRDLIILLEVDPETAVQRIESRIAAEEAILGEAPMRKKWRHLHENVDDLSLLAHGYHQALACVKSIADTRVVRVQTDDMSPDEVIDEAKTYIQETRIEKVAP